MRNKMVNRKEINLPRCKYCFKLCADFETLSIHEYFCQKDKPHVSALKVKI
jgi:hypothetical protein